MTGFDGLRRRGPRRIQVAPLRRPQRDAVARPVDAFANVRLPAPAFRTITDFRGLTDAFGSFADIARVAELEEKQAQAESLSAGIATQDPALGDILRGVFEPVPDQEFEGPPPPPQLVKAREDVAKEFRTGSIPSQANFLLTGTYNQQHGVQVGLGVVRQLQAMRVQFGQYIPGSDGVAPGFAADVDESLARFAREAIDRNPGLISSDAAKAGFARTLNHHVAILKQEVMQDRDRSMIAAAPDVLKEPFEAEMAEGMERVLHGGPAKDSAARITDLFRNVLHNSGIALNGPQQKSVQLGLMQNYLMNLIQDADGEAFAEDDVHDALDIFSEVKLGTVRAGTTQAFDEIRRLVLTKLDTGSRVESISSIPGLARALPRELYDKVFPVVAQLQKVLSDGQAANDLVEVDAAREQLTSMVDSDEFFADMRRPLTERQKGEVKLRINTLVSAMLAKHNTYPNSSAVRAEALRDLYTLNDPELVEAILESAIREGTISPEHFASAMDHVQKFRDGTEFRGDGTPYSASVSQFITRADELKKLSIPINVKADVDASLRAGMAAYGTEYKERVAQLRADGQSDDQVRASMIDWNRTRGKELIEQGVAAFEEFNATRVSSRDLVAQWVLNNKRPNAEEVQRVVSALGQEEAAGLLKPLFDQTSIPGMMRGLEGQIALADREMLVAIDQHLSSDPAFQGIVTDPEQQQRAQQLRSAILTEYKALASRALQDDIQAITSTGDVNANTTLSNRLREHTRGFVEDILGEQSVLISEMRRQGLSVTEVSQAFSTDALRRRKAGFDIIQAEKTTPSMDGFVESWKAGRAENATAAELAADIGKRLLTGSTRQSVSLDRGRLFSEVTRQLSLIDASQMSPEAKAQARYDVNRLVGALDIDNLPDVKNYRPYSTLFFSTPEKLVAWQKDLDRVHATSKKLGLLIPKTPTMTADSLKKNANFAAFVRMQRFLMRTR